jgi:hypothetical protein
VGIAVSTVIKAESFNAYVCVQWWVGWCACGRLDVRSQDPQTNEPIKHQTNENKTKSQNIKNKTEKNPTKKQTKQGKPQKKSNKQKYAPFKSKNIQKNK